MKKIICLFLTLSLQQVFAQVEQPAQVQEQFKDSAWDMGKFSLQELEDMGFTVCYNAQHYTLTITQDGIEFPLHRVTIFNGSVAQKIRYLDMSNSNLSELPDLTPMKALSGVDFSGNARVDFTKLQESLPKSVSQIILKECGLANLPPLKKLIALEQLDVSSNPLTSITDDFLPQSLVILIANKTDIQSIDVSKLLLRKVCLCHNQYLDITRMKLPATVFELRLIKCGLTQVPHLQDLVALRYLYLSCNALTLPESLPVLPTTMRSLVVHECGFSECVTAADFGLLDDTDITI